MADLSNLLGAVYGESAPPAPSNEDRDPDGPPTPVEKAAGERVPLADDLAAALSEALVAQEADDADLDVEHGEHGDPAPQLSPEREAAVELMHASRPDSEPFGPVPVEEHDDPVPEPRPAPMAKVEPIAIDDLPGPTDDHWAAPTAPTPAPLPVPVTVPGVPQAVADPSAPRGSQQWDRANDDILPTKAGGKKFFSLSLRRG